MSQESYSAPEEYRPGLTVGFHPGMLDYYIKSTQSALREQSPAKIRLLRQRLPNIFDQAVDNGQDIDNDKVGLVGSLIDQLQAADDRFQKEGK